MMNEIFWQRIRPFSWQMLVLLVGVALFPYGWLAERWWLFGRVTDTVFSGEWAHVVGHLVLYAVLGTAVLLAVPGLRQRWGLYLMLMLTVGAGQELLQMLTFKHRFVTGNDLFDLLVDGLGAALAWAFFSKRYSVNSIQ